MKKIRWKILLFVVWLMITTIALDVCLRAVSLPSTESNILGVVGWVLWVLLSIATNCFTFKHKYNEKKD